MKMNILLFSPALLLLLLLTQGLVRTAGHIFLMGMIQVTEEISNVRKNKPGQPDL